MEQGLPRWAGLFLTTLIVVASIGLLFWDAPIAYLSGLIGDNVVLSSFVFVVLLTLATVLAPIAILPAIPAIAVMMGPFLTGVLSVIGWTLGSVIAFLIARYAGKPLLERFFSFETIKKYEHMIPEDAQFITIVILRMLVPADILSYALGLTSTIRLWKYTLATLIGVSWFSFAFAYLGEAFYTNNINLLIVVIGGSLVVSLLGWYLILQKKNKVQ